MEFAGDQAIEAAARAAYRGYRRAVGGVSIKGESLPDWEALSDKVQAGWMAAAREAIVSHLRRVLVDALRSEE